MQQTTLSLPLVGEKTKAQKGKIINPGIQTYLVPFFAVHGTSQSRQGMNMAI